MKSIKELSREALDIQNACNSCGLVQRFAQVMIELGEFTNGTSERNSHPIVVLWLDKLNSLAGIQSFEGSAHDRISEAFNEVHKLASE